MERECCDGVYQCPCPPVGLIDVVGKKWAMCVVSLLGWNGELRFGPIQRSLPRVSPATLTATLRALERERLIRRSSSGVARGSPVSYGLTTRGTELYRNLLPLAGWLRNPTPGRRPVVPTAVSPRQHGRTA
ncbi:MAG: helix-turn-helix transcriptional regulator [Thermoplasmata archaeon]|nr:helix-turn-helix transcriptional regulator [Thermoplasmata archaeon]